MHIGFWIQAETTAQRITAAHTESLPGRSVPVFPHECNQQLSSKSKPRKLQQRRMRKDGLPETQLLWGKKNSRTGRTEDARWCWSHVLLLAVRVIHWTPCPLSEGGNNKQEHLAFPSMKRPKPTVLLCSLSCCRNQLQTALGRKQKDWNLTKMNFYFHCCEKGEGDSDSCLFACNCYCRHDCVTGTVI